MSEILLEEEEEEDIEETSVDSLEDFENFINEDDESDFVLEEDEVREVLATAWKQKRREISKERLRRGLGKPSKSAATPVTGEFPRGSGGGETENEMLPMWQCGTIVQENVRKNRHKVTKDVEEETR